MEKIEISSKPSQIVEYIRGKYYPDNSENSYIFTIEVIKIPSADDVTFGELQWEDEIPENDSIAEEVIKENFFDAKVRKTIF
jgi:hypothetical protein